MCAGGAAGSLMKLQVWVVLPACDWPTLKQVQDWKSSLSFSGSDGRVTAVKISVEGIAKTLRFKGDILQLRRQCDTSVFPPGIIKPGLQWWKLHSSVVLTLIPQVLKHCEAAINWTFLQNKIDILVFWQNAIKICSFHWMEPNRTG